VQLEQFVSDKVFRNNNKIAGLYVNCNLIEKENSNDKSSYKVTDNNFIIKWNSATLKKVVFFYKKTIDILTIYILKYKYQ